MNISLPHRRPRLDTLLLCLLAVSLPATRNQVASAQADRASSVRLPAKDAAIIRSAGHAQLPGKLKTLLRMMGHRNWIAIVDFAYPLQTAPGIETAALRGDQLGVTKKLLAHIDTLSHVRASVYVDKELGFVSEKDAPGIETYRKGLNQLLAGKDVRRQLHADTIRKLDEDAKTYRIMIIKTDSTLPYTSVFIQLDCGYWNDAAETRLRARMKDR